MRRRISQIFWYSTEQPLKFYLIIFFGFLVVYSVLLFGLKLIIDPSLLESITKWDVLLRVGIIAGILQLIGYVLYLADETIDPNPVTWLMFGYGTAILTILEWDKNATFSELILPTVCSILGVVVSIRCWWYARRANPRCWWPEDWWPDDFWEQASFISDLVITLAYVIAWIMATYALITFESKEFAVLLFLFLSNISTFPGFYPILHTTYHHPEREYWLPWIVWSIAYGLLGWVTYQTHNQLWHALMFYPASNALMHAIVGVFALRKRSTGV